MVDIKKHIKRLLIATTLILTSPMANADDKDFATDINAEIEKDITKKWGVSVGEGLRLRNNDHNLDRLGTSVSTDYEVLKWLKVGAGYEFLADWNGYDKQYFTYRNRWNISAGGKYKFNKRLNAGLKAKFQQTYRCETYKTYSQYHKDYVRVKVEGEYKIKKKPLYTHLSVETFYFCNSIDGNTIDDIRYLAGVTYKPSKKHSVDLSFQIDDEMNVANPEDRFMLCASYKFKF